MVMMRLHAMARHTVHPLFRMCVGVESATKMTDRGMGAVADLVARHPALQKLDFRGAMCIVFGDVRTGNSSGGVLLSMSLLAYRQPRRI